jgi:hypothetical protein
MPEPRDHLQDRNWLETLLHNIPGFHGYLEKENRRDSDALAREALADRLTRGKRAIDEATRALADRGQIGLLPKFDRLRGRLDKLIGRIRGAMAGYSGVFDLVAVDEARLDRIYEHDVILLERVEHAASDMKKLDSLSDESAATAALAELGSQLDEIEQAWDRREDLLKGLE